MLGRKEFVLFQPAVLRPRLTAQCTDTAQGSMPAAEPQQHNCCFLSHTVSHSTFWRVVFKCPPFPQALLQSCLSSEQGCLAPRTASHWRLLAWPLPMDRIPNVTQGSSVTSEAPLPPGSHLGIRPGAARLQPVGEWRPLHPPFLCSLRSSGVSLP